MNFSHQLKRIVIGVFVFIFSCFVFLFSCLLVDVATAQTATSTRPVVSATSNAMADLANSQPLNAFGFQWDSVIKPGQTIATGEYWLETRPFGAWKLDCEHARVVVANATTNPTTCAIESVSGTDTDKIVWHLGVTTDKRNIMMIYLPPDTDVATGVKLAFAGVERPVARILCLQGSGFCAMATEVNAQLIGLMNADRNVSVSFSRGGRPVTILASMDGFLAALNHIAISSGHAPVPSNSAQPVAKPIAKQVPKPVVKPAVKTIQQTAAPAQ